MPVYLSLSSPSPPTLMPAKISCLIPPPLTTISAFIIKSSKAPMMRHVAKIVAIIILLVLSADTDRIPLAKRWGRVRLLQRSPQFAGEE